MVEICRNIYPNSCNSARYRVRVNEHTLRKNNHHYHHKAFLIFSCPVPAWVLWSVHGAECLSLLLSASEWLLPKGRNLSRVLEFSLPLNLPPCFPLSLCTTPHVLSSSPCPILHIQIIGLNYLMQTNMRWCILIRIRPSCRHQNAQNNNLLNDMEIEGFFFLS